MNYRIKYTSVKGKEESIQIVGPFDSKIKDCHRIVGFAASNYGVDMSTLEVEEIPERTSKGFLHSVLALAKGYPEPIPIKGWYF